MKRILTIACLLLLVALFAVNLSEADEPSKRPRGHMDTIKPDTTWDRGSWYLCTADSFWNFMIFHNNTSGEQIVINKEAPPGQELKDPLVIPKDQSRAVIFDCKTDLQGVYIFAPAVKQSEECHVRFECECEMGGYGPSLSEWGIIILLLLFVGTGTWVVLRRRKAIPA